MKVRHLFFALCALSLFSCNKDEIKNYEVIKNELRAPAYPLVTIDPNASAWSMADNLYDESVKHWTGKEFPLLGVIKVDGVPYRFMGIENVEMKPVVPTSEEGEWYGMYTEVKPANNWKDSGFDDSKWKSDKGAFGTKVNEPTAKTDWTTKDIWVRRTITLGEDLAGRNVFLQFSNDDDAIFYINGVEVHNTGSTCNKNKFVKLSAEVVSTLKKGENLIAATCTNPAANGLLDFGLQVPKSEFSIFEKTATQQSVDVQAMQTHYKFTAGGVDLAVTFTAPMFMDNLDLLSRPVNYLSYQVISNDNAAHDVELYFEASPRWALDQPYQESVSETFTDGNLTFLKTGSKEQNILNKFGDHINIDWGYFYLAADKGNALTSVGNSEELRRGFVDNALNAASDRGENDNSKLALVQKLGSVEATQGKVMIGFDDIYSIQYFKENLRGYWNRKGTSSIVEQFHLANKEFSSLVEKAYAFDKELMETATKSGGKKYAELCALAYRQSVAAHKLVEAPNGDLLWLSKENDSNGSIGTVDVTYPSAPLYLYYNPELAKGLLNHIFYYSESGRWTKPFPAHDVGTYPLANGQTYGGDMPVEEGGNMLVLTGLIAEMEGNANYAKRHWDVLTTWTDYLVEYGLDPDNQLCTDDFAGHFAHNANLSIKAIMGVASYGKMAYMLDKKDVGDKYTNKAKEMAVAWEKMANDGDHYRLTFDKAGTWSQKYNMVWDKVLELGIFPEGIIDTELAYYLTKQNKYGLPLDNRETYTKTDWIIWTATMSNDQATFEKFINPLHLFMNETIDRVPMSDWVFTDKANRRGFMARSVVGGYYIKMLEDKLNARKK